MELILPAISNLTEGKAATPIAFIQAMILAYERYGLSPANALRLAQIPPSFLCDATKRVTAAQMEMMSAVTMQELDDEALGWFKRKLPWGTYGMLCRASLTSPNLGIALKRWCRHHRLLTDDITLSLSSTAQETRVTCVLKRDIGAMREFCLVTNLRYILGYACWVIDSRIPLSGASFPFAPPAHAEVYPHLFPGPIHFNAQQAELRFDTQYLTLPLRRDERDLRQMLQRAILVTVLPYKRDRLLIQRIRQLFQQTPAEHWTAETIAQRLNLSLRTLHRHLQEEGAALQPLKDEARSHKAKELLNRTTWPIKQIAQAVGFQNEKSFSRAFKQWTHSSPQEFRQQHATR